MLRRRERRKIERGFRSSSNGRDYSCPLFFHLCFPHPCLPVSLRASTLIVQPWSTGLQELHHRPLRRHSGCKKRKAMLRGKSGSCQLHTRRSPTLRCARVRQWGKLMPAPATSRRQCAGGRLSLLSGPGRWESTRSGQAGGKTIASVAGDGVPSFFVMGLGKEATSAVRPGATLPGPFWPGEPRSYLVHSRPVLSCSGFCAGLGHGSCMLPRGDN